MGWPTDAPAVFAEMAEDDEARGNAWEPSHWKEFESQFGDGGWYASVEPVRMDSHGALAARAGGRHVAAVLGGLPWRLQVERLLAKLNASAAPEVSAKVIIAGEPVHLSRNAWEHLLLPGGDVVLGVPSLEDAFRAAENRRPIELTREQKAQLRDVLRRYARGREHLGQQLPHGLGVLRTALEQEFSEAQKRRGRKEQGPPAANPQTMLGGSACIAAVLIGEAAQEGALARVAVEKRAAAASNLKRAG